MTLAPSRGVVLASAVALLMHLCLFTVVRSSDGWERVAPLASPETRYTEPNASQEATNDMVRIVESPIIFSLPSQMGFSRSLSENDVQTRKTFMQPPIRSEQFLKTSVYTQRASDHLHPEELMISAAPREPFLPAPAVAEAAPYSSSRRVMMSSGLQDRLVGGIVMPAGLNKTVDKPWTVHASINISDQGAVEHVMLDQPLEPASLNREILHLLYNLRFKPGKAVDGSIDIYSPESGAAAGGVQ